MEKVGSYLPCEPVLVRKLSFASDPWREECFVLIPCEFDFRHWLHTERLMLAHQLKCGPQASQGG